MENLNIQAVTACKSHIISILLIQKAGILFVMVIPFEKMKVSNNGRETDTEWQLVVILHFQNN